MPLVSQRSRRDRFVQVGIRDRLPQPSFVPQTVTGAAALDDFNAGATQLLTARAGWSPTGVAIAGDASFRTDAVPTVADVTFTPASNHSNVWNFSFKRDREVWMKIGTAPVTASPTVMVMSANQASFAPYHQLFWTPSGFLRLTNNNGSVDIQTSVGVPATGDMFCLQQEFPYLYAWVKKAAGSWTLIMSAVDATLPNDGYIGMFFQAGGSALTVDQFGGGSLFDHQPHITVVRLTGPGG